MTGGNVGATVSTVAIPTSTCTLASGGKTTSVPYMWYDTDGFLSNSGDSTLVHFACYKQPLGQILNGGAAITKAIVVVDGSGAIDASTTFTAPYGGGTSTSYEYHFTLHSVASQDGSTLYLSASGGYYTSKQLYSGYVLFTRGIANQAPTFMTSTTSNTPGYDDGRCVGVYNLQLYGSDGNYDGNWQGLFSLGSGLPLNAGPPSLLFKATTLSPWTFVFESASSVWFADTQTSATANVIHYTLSGSTWAKAGSGVSFEPGVDMYSIAGRAESGQFIVYALSPMRVWRYETTTTLKTVVLAAPSGAVLRGIAFAPFNPAWLAPTPSPSQTSSSTPTPTQTPSSTGTSTGSPSVTPTGTSSGSGSPTTSSTVTGSPSATPSSSSSPSPSESIGATKTASPSFSLSGSNTPSNPPSASATTTGSAVGTATSTGSVSPTATGSSSRTGSAAATPSVTPTLTTSSSRTPIINFWPTASVIVLRLGSADVSVASSANGTGLPIFLDAIASSGNEVGVTLQSVSVPSSACTLARGDAGAYGAAANQLWPDTEGFPSISSDGTVLTFACTRVALGAATSGRQTVTKVFAVVDATGAVDTSTTSSWPYGGAFTSTYVFALRTVVTVNGSALYASAAGGYYSAKQLDARVALLRFGAASQTPTFVSGTTVSTPGFNDFRAVSVYNGQLYGTDDARDASFQGVFAIGTGMPTAAAVSAPVFTSAALSPWTLAWESSTSVWVADDSAVATANILHVAYSAATVSWSQTGSASLAPGAPIYSIAGRSEAGAFVVYATTPSTLYRYNTVTGAKSVITTAAPGTVLRGVALPPLNPVWLAPTPDITATPSVTPSATPSTSFSLTAAATPSASALATSTQTPSNSPTPTASLSIGATASATPSPSGTPSSSRTGTGTRTPVATPTTTRTSSKTAAATHTATSSASHTGSASSSTTGTTSGTETGTPSRTGSGSASGTATSPVTPTKTGTASRTSARTHSDTPSGTAAVTAASTVSGTISASVTAAVTATGSPSHSVTATGTPPSTMSPSSSAAVTPSSTPSRSSTASPPSSGTPTGTPTSPPSSTATGTPRSTGTVTGMPPTSTVSRSRLPTVSLSPTKSSTTSVSTSHSLTRSRSATASPTRSPSGSKTGTATPSPTHSKTATRTITRSPTATKSRTRSATATRSISRSRTITRTKTRTPAPTQKKKL